MGLNRASDAPEQVPKRLKKVNAPGMVLEAQTKSPKRAERDHIMKDLKEAEELMALIPLYKDIWTQLVGDTIAGRFGVSPEMTFWDFSRLTRRECETAERLAALRRTGHHKVTAAGQRRYRFQQRRSHRQQQQGVN